MAEEPASARHGGEHGGGASVLALDQAQRSIHQQIAALQLRRCVAPPAARGARDPLMAG
ncbi:hypothetical protein [Streptomyces sp. 378]|uniref:hypothetical protein n=1 Tax=Streptomyces sp. 378 TaxID=3049412 RepID=UPI0024C376F6|nr:hypothetical protein [Streptomyces sp. 378]